MNNNNNNLDDFPPHYLSLFSAAASRIVTVALSPPPPLISHPSTFTSSDTDAWVTARSAIDDDGELTELRHGARPPPAPAPALNLRDLVLDGGQERQGMMGRGGSGGGGGDISGRMHGNDGGMHYERVMGTGGGGRSAMSNEEGVSVPDGLTEDTATTAMSVSEGTASTGQVWARRVYARSESSLDPPRTTALQALRRDGALYVGHAMPQRCGGRLRKGRVWTGEILLERIDARSFAIYNNIISPFFLLGFQTDLVITYFAGRSCWDRWSRPKKCACWRRGFGRWIFHFLMNNDLRRMGSLLFYLPLFLSFSFFVISGTFG